MPHSGGVCIVIRKPWVRWVRLLWSVKRRWEGALMRNMGKYMSLLANVVRRLGNVFYISLTKTIIIQSTKSNNKVNWAIRLVLTWMAKNLSITEKACIILLWQAKIAAVKKIYWTTLELYRLFESATTFTLVFRPYLSFSFFFLFLYITFLVLNRTVIIWSIFLKAINPQALQNGWIVFKHLKQHVFFDFWVWEIFVAIAAINGETP